MSNNIWRTLTIQDILNKILHKEQKDGWMTWISYFPPIPNRRMKIVIGTPAFGGLIHTEYFNSILVLLADKEIQKDYNIIILTIKNDSFIIRARQEIVKIAINQHADKLLFIDADIKFTIDQFRSVVSCGTKLVVGGTFRKKILQSSTLSYNIKTDIGSEIRRTCGSYSSTPKGWYFLKKNYADEYGCIPAIHIPIGFTCIDCRVFDFLKSKIPYYVSDQRDPHKLYYSQHEMYDMRTYSFFNSSIKNHILETPDWAFCTLCRKYGIDVWLQTRAVCTHVGSVPLIFEETFT